MSRLMIRGGASLQGQEDEGLASLLARAAKAWRSVAAAVVPVVVLGGEDEGSQPAGVC